jgi:hypothetical protein
MKTLATGLLVLSAGILLTIAVPILLVRLDRVTASFLNVIPAVIAIELAVFFIIQWLVSARQLGRKE